MRNAVYPSCSTQLCSFGNNQVQMPNSSDVSEDVHGSSFFRESQVPSDHHLGNFAPLSTVEVPQTLNYLHLPGLLTSSMYENAAQRNPFPVPHSEAGIQNARKRTIKGDGGSINNEKAEQESKKKKAAMCMENVQCPFHPTEEQPSETQDHRAPVRRSQKIGDKITALQKLVSPFGKTDTASVLQEASVCIKLLQEQIQMLSAPYFTVPPLRPQGVEERKLELRSRGLCLVPVSYTQNITKEDGAVHSISRRSIIPRNHY